jgi:hypothetical protein
MESVDDIIKLIQACKTHGVNSFKQGDLQFELAYAPLMENGIGAKPAESPKQVLSQLELETKRLELDNLRLEDPLEFERLQQFDKEQA